jgi:hypothetical protein
MNIYQDESGCLGFQKGSSDYFVVTILCPDNSKHLGHLIRKFKGTLIKSGWPRDIEIKAHNLFLSNINPKIPSSYKYKNSPNDALIEILTKLAQCNIEIDTIIVKKCNIEVSLRTLPYGILWNYFSGRVLVSRIIKYDEVNLYVDEHNKESHNELHFDGYIKTSALITKGCSFPLNIEHGNSNVVTGISAVDFICWAIFRNYESSDPTFYNLIKSKIINNNTYFFK